MGVISLGFKYDYEVIEMTDKEIEKFKDEMGIVDEGDIVSEEDLSFDEESED